MKFKLLLIVIVILAPVVGVYKHHLFYHFIDTHQVMLNVYEGRFGSNRVKIFEEQFGRGFTKHDLKVTVWVIPNNEPDEYGIHVFLKGWGSQTVSYYDHSGRYKSLSKNEENAKLQTAQEAMNAVYKEKYIVTSFICGVRKK